MIHEEICTYEVCKLAKEKGFPQDPDKNDHSQMYCWDRLRKIHTLSKWEMWYLGEYNNEDMYAAPTQSLLQRWLREEKGIMIEIAIWLQADGTWRYRYKIQTKEEIISSLNGYNSYELALEYANEHALEKLV